MQHSHNHHTKKSKTAGLKHKIISVNKVYYIEWNLKKTIKNINVAGNKRLTETWTLYWYPVNVNETSNECKLYMVDIVFNTMFMVTFLYCKIRMKSAALKYIILRIGS